MAANCKPTASSNLTPGAVQAGLRFCQLQECAVRPHPAFFQDAGGAFRTGRCHKKGNRDPICRGLRRSRTEAPQVFTQSFTPEGFRLSFPPMSASVPLGALIGWMVLLTVKQGSESRLVSSAARPLRRALRRCARIHPDRRAPVLVLGRDRFCHSLHGRSLQGAGVVATGRDTGKPPSVVLDVDRRGPGVAPPHRLRPVDLHGRELIRSNAVAMPFRLSPP
jgi:hypothetical protein